MPIGRSASEALQLAGWEAVTEIPQGAIQRLEEASEAAIKLFDQVSEIYEIFHHAESDRWMLITDGAESFTPNAERMLIASANPNRLDTDRAGNSTMVFTIGRSEKTVSSWLVWVGAQNNFPQRRPDRGFNYIS